MPVADLSGLTSLERVELMSAVEDRFQVDLNESKFTAATTISDLEEMLRAPSVQRTDFFYPRWVQRWPITWIRRVVYYLADVACHSDSFQAKDHRSRAVCIDEKGPVLVVCNHVTYLDVGFVLAALPHHLRNLAIAMEGERVQRMRRPPKDWRWWERVAACAAYWSMTPLFHVFPLPQRGGFRESFRFAGDAADKGYSVLVFPEGLRTPDGKLWPFRSGIGLARFESGLARRAHAHTRALGTEGHRTTWVCALGIDSRECRETDSGFQPGTDPLRSRGRWRVACCGISVGDKNSRSADDDLNSCRLTKSLNLRTVGSAAPRTSPDSSNQNSHASGFRSRNRDRSHGRHNRPSPRPPASK